MTNHESRATSNGRRGLIILWAIVLCALALRLWGAAHQLPFKTNIEEDDFIYTALKYGTGDLNPHWFFHPPLYSYLLFGLYGVFYLAGSLAGLFSGPDDFIVLYLSDPTGFYLIARVFNAVLAVPAILLIYRLGRGLFSRRCALAACFFFAVMPLDLLYSHLGCTEPLLVVFVLLSAVFAYRVMSGGGLGNSLCAGACAGLAAGTKYIGVFSFALLLVAHLVARDNRRWGRLVASVVAGAIAFLAVCPFPLLSSAEYIENISLLLSQPLNVGEYAWDKFANLHLLFLTRYIPEGMGFTLAWLSLAGLAFLWLRHRSGDLLVAIVPTAFLVVIGFSRLYYDRYMLICYPFFALAAACLLEAACARLSRGSGALFAGLCVLIAIPSVHRSMGVVSALLLPDTRFLAARWITDNLPEGTRILIDVSPVPPNEASLMRLQRMKLNNPRRDYGYRDKSDAYFRLQRRAALLRKGFDVTEILHPRGFHMTQGGKGYEHEWMTPERMKGQLDAVDEYDYVLISEHKAWRYGDRSTLPERFLFMNDFYGSIKAKGTPVKSFGAREGESRGNSFTLYKVN